jgi:phosphotransferase system  glucose/maltose/N-acetylglucosamine-specific IIC component
MSENQYGSKYAPKKPSPLKPFYPVIGLLVLVIFGAIAFAVSQPITNFIDQRVTTMPLPVSQLRIIVGVGVFIVLTLLLAMTYSIFQPKTPKGVSERDLDREKQERQKEEKAAARRKKEMQAKMRARNRQNNERG